MFDHVPLQVVGSAQDRTTNRAIPATAAGLLRMAPNWTEARSPLLPLREKGTVPYALALPEAGASAPASAGMVLWKWDQQGHSRIPAAG